MLVYLLLDHCVLSVGSFSSMAISHVLRLDLLGHFVLSVGSFLSVALTHVLKLDRFCFFALPIPFRC